MGSLIIKLRKENKLMGAQLHQQSLGVQAPVEKEEEKAQERVVMKRQKRMVEQIEGRLLYRQISDNKKQAIQKSPNIIQLIQSDKWIVQPDIIQEFRILNAFELVEESPAITLYLTLIKNGVTLIGNTNKLEQVRTQHKDKQSQPITMFQEYAIIYADLFTIRFSVLRKIKIRGPQKVSAQALCSLQGLTKLQAPCLQELSADDHVLTNVRFLRRCIWPNLWKLSLRGNMVVDSGQMASVIPLLTNSRHIEGIDLAGTYSGAWAEVSWVAKMGFADAEEEFDLLNSDDEYYHRYNNRVLRRVDAAMGGRMRGPHVEMIRHKFNNGYFDNPISLW